MTDTPNDSPEYRSILRKITPDAGETFAREVADRTISSDYHYPYRDLHRLPGPVAKLIWELSERETAGQTDKMQKRLAFIQGALLVTRLVHFAEELDILETQYSRKSSIDDGGVAIPQPSALPGAGLSSGELFLAPPDPEPRPEA